MAQEVDSEFERFRQEILSDFQRERNQYLDSYADFLNETWEEFQQFKGIPRDKRPKPQVQPAAPVPVPDVAPIPVDIPTPDVRPVPVPEPAVTPEPERTPEPEPAPQPIRPRVDEVQVNFCGSSYPVRKLAIQPIRNLDQLGDTWRSYQNWEELEIWNRELTAKQQQLGLNDWFMLQFLKSYSEAVGREASPNERVMMVFFLMTYRGYDVRLGRVGDRLVILYAPETVIYNESFLQEGNKRYYFWTDAKQSKPSVQERIAVCTVPDDLANLKQLNLQMQNFLPEGELLPEKVFSDGPMRVRTRVNRRQMEALRHYPQTYMGVYPSSETVPPFQRDLLDQLKPQLAGKSRQEAVASLLHFMQYAFAYATDGEQHGYEKPYFIEENFYYPKNDCEDRAILFAFLVRNLLGMEVHLVHFPGHECTAVCFGQETIPGASYEYDGKRFTICDPTYIGAGLGECMPQYVSEKPEVELW